MKPFTRIINAHKRLECASKFTESYLHSVIGFIRCKFNSQNLMKGKYKDIDFIFRSADVEALNEVLVEQDYSFLDDFLKNETNPIIIDLGHHIGTFSLWVLSINPNASILALEADPLTYDVAKKNTGQVRSQNLDWCVENFAAWKDDTSVSFSCEGDNMGHKVDDNSQTHVKAMSLKTLIERFDRPVTLMKVDIEGAEEEFITAYPEYLERVQSLVVEIHPKYCSEQKVRDILSNQYSSIIEIQDKKTDKPLLWCKR